MQAPAALEHMEMQEALGLPIPTSDSCSVSNLETLNATKTKQLKETRDVLGEGALRSSTAEPATCPKPFPAALPQALLLVQCLSELLKVQTSRVRDETLPDPSLQEIMPSMRSDWMFCQSLPPPCPHVGPAQL